MIKQKNVINSLIYLFLFFNLFQLQKLNIEKINTWCYVFCGSQNQNFVLLIFITLSVATFIYFFIRYMKDSKLIWFFLIPLIYPIFTTKGNENRELGLAFMQSNNMNFFLPWNGNVFTEQYIYNLIFKNFALIFKNYDNFVFFSRLLIGILFIYSVSKIFENYEKLHIIFCIYLANIFAISFGGEYLILGASPRTLAYSFGFLTIYYYRKKNMWYLFFSIFTALFHLHVYFLMILPYLFFESLLNKDYRKAFLNLTCGISLLVFFIYGNINSQSRSNFINNTFLKNSEGVYINRVIAEEVIPFHVRPFNFDSLNNFIGINDFWNIGFINFGLIVLIYIFSLKNQSYEFSFVVNLNLIIIFIGLLVSYFDINGFFIILYLFKTAIFLSLFLFIYNQFKINIPITALIFSLIFTNWFFQFSASYLALETKENKFLLIEETSPKDSIVVIDNKLRKNFSSLFIQQNIEEYFTGNNLMDDKEVLLREKLNFSSNSFCEELNSDQKYTVISPVQLDCKEYYLFSVNSNFGNLGIQGDPFFKYFDYDPKAEVYCKSDCLRFYSNN